MYQEIPKLTASSPTKINESGMLPFKLSFTLSEIFFNNFSGFSFISLFSLVGYPKVKTLNLNKTRLNLTGKTGFEPATPGVTSQCYNRLSYFPSVRLPTLAN